MDDICDLLSTYNGRDKVVRLACYTLKLWGSASKNEALLKASSKLSATRATMRLFDDLPMLKYSLEYGLGKDEPDGLSSVLGVIANVVDQLFLPLEKIGWLGELGIIKLTDKQMENFDTANTVFWVASLYITLIRCLKQLKLTNRQRYCLTTIAQSPQVQRQMATRYVMETVTCLKLMMDVTHAVNCLPHGWLWGGKLGGVQVGAIATLSSLIGIGMHFAKKKYMN